jgi:hypothetical protein
MMVSATRKASISSEFIEKYFLPTQKQKKRKIKSDKKFTRTMTHE